MFILDRRKFLEITGAAGALAAAGPAVAAGHAKAEVYTSDAQSASVDSVIVMGQEKALLIDAQINVPSASAVADMIDATGRELETVFITHYHPDHLLGLAVIMDRFPNAKPVTHAAIRPKIEETGAAMLANMSGNAPAGVFADRAVVPDALGGNQIMLEGEAIEVLEPMHGDTDLISAVHIPALDTLVTSDIGFADTHAWVRENTTTERIDLWRASLDKLEAIGAGTVIPGHRLETSANDAGVFSHTRAYLDQWQTALASAKSGEELTAAMMEGNEGLGLQFALQMAVGTVFPSN